MNSKQPLSFHEWLKIRDPLLHEQVNESWKANAAAVLMGLGSSMGLVNAQSPTPTANQVNQQEDRSPENIFKGYIVAFKEVSPIKYIRMAQHDKEKFDDDYENLQKPSDDDLGFATLKEKFNKPIEITFKSVELSEWYQEEHLELFVYFDSWQDLTVKYNYYLENNHELLKKKQKIYDYVLQSNILQIEKWRNLFSELTF